MPENNRPDVNLGDLSRIAAGDAPERRAQDPSAGLTSPMRRLRAMDGPVVAGGQRGLKIAVVALLLLVGWLLWQQHRLSASLAVLEARAAESVQSLESRVNSTATSLKSNDSQTQESLNVLAGDIGRVNAAVSRLSAQLAQQGKALADDGAALSALAAEVRTLAESSAQATGNLEARLEARLKAVATLLDQQAARQRTLGEAVTRLERSGDFAQLRSEVAVLGAALREDQEEQARRLKALEQGMASNDAFRRQVNATIDRLAQQVAEVSARR